MEQRELKKCPYCGEEILAVAKKCKHCGNWLEVNDRTYSKEVRSTKKDSSSWRYLYIVVIILALGAFYLIPLLTKHDKPIENNEYSLFRNVDGSAVDTTITESGPVKVQDSEIDEIRQLLTASTYIKYTNSRYGFSVMYPDCFVMGEEPQNGDGCGFSLKYGISFSVWGSYNDIGYYGKNIHEYFLKDADRAKSTYHMQKNNWFVMSGNLDDDNIFYKKVALMDDNTGRGTYVTFYLLFPKKFNNVLTEFINYEAKNFNPIYEGSGNQRIKEDNFIDPLKNLQIEVQSQPKHDEIQNGYTRDQQMALLLLMLAAASDSESGTGDNREMEYPCRSCGLTFTNYADLRSHENAVHDY